MNIKHKKIGLLNCNCYLIEKNNKYLLIDPGDDLDEVEKFINKKNIIGILITHGHFDHIGSVNKLVEKYHFPIYDFHNLKEGDNKIDIFNFEVIKTPGHTWDSICFYFKEDKVMFTGDFLFYHTIGRTDLPGSNHMAMLNSIKKIKKYPKNITIYPGHGIKSTLEEEFIYNQFLQEK